MVVVDVDDESCAVDRVGGRADPALVRTVDCEQHALLEVVRELPAQLAERQKAELARKRRVAREIHEYVFAEGAQAERRAEHRAERVAVGILVRDDEEALVAAKRIRDRGEVSRGRRHRGLLRRSAC